MDYEKQNIFNIHLILKNRRNSFLVFLLQFGVMGFFSHQCDSLQNKMKRLHTGVSTVIHSKAVCFLKIHQISDFFTHS